MRILKDKRDKKPRVPLRFGIVVIWCLFMTMAFTPIYVEGTRSMLLRLTKSHLSTGNRAFFSLAAFCIFFPIMFGWRRSARIGTSVQVGILLGIILWLHYYDALVLITWFGYAGRLILACSGIALIISVIFWLTSIRESRAHS